VQVRAEIERLPAQRQKEVTGIIVLELKDQAEQLQLWAALERLLPAG